IVTDGKDRGVVFEAQIDQYVQRPQRSARDREAGRPVAEHALAEEVLEKALGTLSLLPELALRLAVDQLMGEAMTGDLVSRSRDALHQARRLLRHPAEHEKGAVDALLREQPQNALGIGFHPIFARRPALAGDSRGQRGHLEIVLDID